MTTAISKATNLVLFFIEFPPFQDWEVTNSPLENDLVGIQDDFADGANGTDVEGVGDARGLLGEGHGDVGSHSINESVEDYLGHSAVGVLLLGLVRGGVVLTGNVELTVADADEDLVGDGGTCKVGAVVACGVEEVHGLESQLALLGAGQVTACVMGGILGLDTAVSLQYDVILRGEISAGSTEDVGQGDLVIGRSLTDLRDISVPIGIGNHGKVAQIHVDLGRQTHVLTDTACGETALHGGDGDHDIPGKGLQAGDGGHVAAVVIGGDHHVGADDLLAGGVLPVDRPVHALVLSGLGQDGGGQGMLQDTAVGGGAGAGGGGQLHEGRAESLHGQAVGDLGQLGSGVLLLTETVGVAGCEGEGGEHRHHGQQDGQILLEILLHRVIPP